MLKSYDGRGYTEQINRYSQTALQCSQHGIFMTDLRGKYQPGYRWSMKIVNLNRVGKETVKAVVTTFLQDQYCAAGIVFFKPAGSDEFHYRVEFYRGDE